MFSNKNNKKLDDLWIKLNDARQTFVGYPCNQGFNYSDLERFFEFGLNNVGDPFSDSPYFQLNTHEFEKEVLQFFAKITNVYIEEFWGYVTSGGTEGNMHGLYLARELFPNHTVYFSKDTHYSILKIMRLLNMRYEMIESLPNGEIDYKTLDEKIDKNRKTVPIILANIGTTMKGAVDDIDRIKEIFKYREIEKNYIHCDAALSGMILPFIKDSQPFDFNAGADSISISGHKFIGSPIPCGVTLALKKNVNKIANFVEYIGTIDSTITGSRSGLTSLILWYGVKRHGRKGFKKMVCRCISLADFTIAEFKKNGIKAWRNKNSITVIFPKPSDKILAKWQLAPMGDITHAIILPHLSRKTLKRMVEDIALDF